jgi:hypothetical protein
VEKSGASALVAHAEKGRPLKFVRRLSTFTFESVEIRLRTQTTHKSKPRTFDREDLPGFVTLADYLRTEGSNPFFDVVATDTTSLISFGATCADTFYGFANGKFLGPFEAVEVQIHCGTPTRSTLFPISDTDDDRNGRRAPYLHVEVVLAEEPFHALFRHLWISSSPAKIRVTVSVPCFETPNARTALSGYGEEVVLEAGELVVAQVDAIDVEKALCEPTQDRQAGENAAAALDPGQVWDRASVTRHAAEIAQGVKRLVLIAAIAAGMTIAAAILRF